MTKNPTYLRQDAIDVLTKKRAEAVAYMKRLESFISLIEEGEIAGVTLEPVKHPTESGKGTGDFIIHITTADKER